MYLIYFFLFVLILTYDLWSIQYAFSNSALKHKSQMFFKAHLRKKFPFVLFQENLSYQSHCNYIYV